MLILTRFLYNYDEVKINLLLSLLTKKEFRKVIFWSSEIYCSGFKKELWDYIWKIYYDFYALLSSGEEIKKNYKKYLKENKFNYILKTLFVLFHSKVSFDVFIVNNLYKVRKMSIKTKKKMKISNIKKMLKFFLEEKLIKKFVIKLKHALQINKEETTKFILEEFGNHELNEEFLFQQLFIISQKPNATLNTTLNAKPNTKLNTKPKIKISKTQKAYVLKLINFKFEKQNIKYKILKNMRYFSISEYTNSFKLEREKLDIKSIFRQNWEYHANFSPFWNEKFKLYKGNKKNKKIIFNNDDNYENFYEQYNLEPGEQHLDVQEKSTKNLKKYKTTELITKLFGDKPILLELDNKIDFEKIKY
tara:strand:+ start:7284 stop:8366 length:1083 start_codon:yes stop_codon:yes gene_type:complete